MSGPRDRRRTSMPPAQALVAPAGLAWPAPAGPAPAEPVRAGPAPARWAPDEWAAAEWAAAEWAAAEWPPMGRPAPAAEVVAANPSPPAGPPVEVAGLRNIGAAIAPALLAAAGRTIRRIRKARSTTRTSASTMVIISALVRRDDHPWLGAGSAIPGPGPPPAPAMTRVTPP